jgi:NADH dehydrogenase
MREINVALPSRVRSHAADATTAAARGWIGMSLPIVTVFGGTGFLGRRVVHRLRDQGFGVRVAVRRPAYGRELFDLNDSHIQLVTADVNDGPSVASALAGAYGAVNAVSLYLQRGGETFHSVHVTAAGQVAAHARLAGVERLVHVSGVGADPASPSLYIRKRGEGEHVVRDAFPAALLIRPAVMFGPDDAFLSVILNLLRRSPVYPLFGRGEMRLQPAYVEDTAEAIARALQRIELAAATFECGGPSVYGYRALLEIIAAAAGRHPLLVPTPFVVWRLLARVCERLPTPPITINQVELMQIDTVASPHLPGFAELGIAPQPLESVLHRMVRPLARSPSSFVSSGGGP